MIAKEIEYIVLLKPEILAFARDIDDKHRKSIEELLKIFETSEIDMLKTEHIQDLMYFIGKIGKKDNEIRNPSFVRNFSLLVDHILTNANIFVGESKTCYNNIEDRVQELEDKVGLYNKIFDEIQDVSKYYNNIYDSMVSLDQKLEDVAQKEKILDNIKEYREQEISKNNFDLLSSGFSSILYEKKNKLNILKRLLILFGLIILFIPTTLIICDIFQVKIFNYNSSIVAFIIIELFVIYYFKIFLHNYNEIKEQVLQIDNKQVLLGFISNYLKFKDTNSIADSSINKLEEIIFSRISIGVKQNPMAPDLTSIIEKLSKIIQGRNKE